VRDYAADCGEHLSVPLSLWDETFSSRQAHDVLKERGMNRRKRHARVDAVAAALFLQEYLDYQRTAAAVPPDSAETPTTP
jgi:putative Holliday junction resolvase